MKMLRMAAIALGGLLAVSVVPAEAMPLSQAPASITEGVSTDLQTVQYGYGYRRPYGYGYRRPYGYGRPYGYRRFGYRRPFVPGYGRRFGYGRYGYRRAYRYGY